MAKTKLKIIPLGGAGEIGKNMTLFEYGNEAIIVDTGIMFPTNDMLGVDYIIPDFRYLLERKDLKIHAIFYTHGHEDHTGAVAHVVDSFRRVPIYATPLTSGLLEVKLRDAKLFNETTIHTFKAGDTIKVGPFTLESFHMCHSIPDCVGFSIQTPVGKIVHSGDYKFDNTPVDGKQPDYARLAQLGKEGVLMLLADSTNADRPGWTPSETVIDGAFNQVFSQAKGRIIVATFASLISRIQQVANAAQKHGRKMAIAGYSMTANVKMAMSMGILNIPDGLLVDLNKIDTIQPHKLVIMVTGSQGEPSSVLAKIANNQHRQLDVMKDDTIVLSSHPIPGNEEMVSRIINKLFQRGANVIYDPILPVHVSGHACQDEMRLLLNLVKPKYFMPVHGELRHLRQHAKLAVESGIPEKNIFVVENGMVLEVDKQHVKVTERIPGGYVFVDGSGVGDIGPSVMRDREMLARDGFLLVTVDVDKNTGKVIGEPEIVSRGFIYLRDADQLLSQVKDLVSETMISTRGMNGRRRERLQENLSRMLFNETKRKPMVFSIINER